jgi:hypothetical protein
MNNSGEKFYILFFLAFFIALVVFILGTIFKPRDVLMRETDNYLYYKEYTLFGLDSACYKYHKPIEYNGIVSDKFKSSHFVGVPGKGGHAVVVYRTTVSYDGRTYKYDGSWVYDHYEKGDKVIVTETFYPKYKIDFRHK